ncbi:GNAT family N-acetyltransferase [Tsukamurella ocularis]|uniref:GNAT family N-acetyltransferase n=1 Tax=Tsukamurella ocularis TaxID=1970234 RepID=UPI0039F1329B
MTAGGDETQGGARRFLIDTNVFIALEPYAGSIEPGQAPAAEFVRLAAKQEHKVYLHPASRDELSEGLNRDRATQRLAEFAKYLTLDEAPISAALRAAAGDSKVGTNDHRDLRILAALAAGAVHHLVTDDRLLRKRAARAGLADYVLTVADAAALLADLEPGVVPPPPMVDEIVAYALDKDQEIFDSLRLEYDGFDTWLSEKVQKGFEDRRCLVIKDDDGTYAAIAIIKKREDDCEYAALKDPVSKISTFKVMSKHRGSRYGELLLKAVMLSQRLDGVASSYVEILPSHPDLVSFLKEFGFEVVATSSGKGELVAAKYYEPLPGDENSLDAFEYHRRFAPSAISPKSKFFIVPIRPTWHEQLFPESIYRERVGEQLKLGPPLSTHPWGNALRKAYIANSNIEKIRRGDVLLFYQSGTLQTVMAVGVVESTLRSWNHDEVLSLTGGRTVYSHEDVRALCQHQNGALVILFRQDRLLEDEIGLGELKAAGVLRQPPQTIAEVKGEGLNWIRQFLNVPQ